MFVQTKLLLSCNFWITGSGGSESKQDPTNDNRFIYGAVVPIANYSSNFRPLSRYRIAPSLFNDYSGITSSDAVHGEDFVATSASSQMGNTNPSSSSASILSVYASSSASSQEAPICRDDHKSPGNKFPSADGCSPTLKSQQFTLSRRMTPYELDIYRLVSTEIYMFIGVYISESII